MFQGTLTALITPFRDENSLSPAVDYETLENLIEWQLECGVDGLVMCGTTGESPTLTDEERTQIVKRTIQVVKKRVPIIVGTGTYSTAQSVEQTKIAKALGADGALVVTPYYNKPTQEGLYQHFKAVADHGGLPVILYDIPGRSCADISVETFRRLVKVPNIVGVKESPISPTKFIELGEFASSSFSILAGDCGLTYEAFSVGGRGVISAAASLIPREMVAITTAGLKGDLEGARRAQLAALPFIRAVFSETNPIPVKAGLKIIGQIPSDRMRLPLVPASPATRDLLATLLSKK